MEILGVSAARLICALAAASVAYAQADWTTTGFDAQRSFWLKSDPKISFDSMRKPGFELVWKVKLSDATGRPSALTPPVLLDFYIGYRGFRSLAFIGSTSNTVTGLDSDLARIEWKKDFGASPAPPGNSRLCSGGMTSGVTRPTSVGYPSALAGRGRGRGTPGKSGVGEPFEGAVTLRPQPPRPAAPPPAPAPSASAAPARRSSAPVSPFGPRVQYVHALSSDGKFHSLYVSNGDEPLPAKPFLPSNANAQNLIVFDGNAYVSTANSCGGVANGIWALNLETSKVSHWKASGDSVTGAGPAAGPDGTLYVTSGAELVALEEGTLRQKASYSIGKQRFASSPVVFEFRGKDLIAASSNDGRLHLLDTATLGASLAATPVFSSPNVASGALASWQDAAGIRWILAPAAGAVAVKAGFSNTNGEVRNGAIVAWKVVDQNGAPAFEPGWVSRDLISPLTPIIVNGVIFAVSSGDTRETGGNVAPAAARNSPRAVLYALDALTGRELWSSGETMTTFAARGGGLAAGGSRVYVATQDGTQYAFGFPLVTDFESGTDK